MRVYVRRNADFSAIGAALESAGYVNPSRTFGRDRWFFEVDNPDDDMLTVILELEPFASRQPIDL